MSIFIIINVYQVVSSVSELDIPGHVLILLSIISVFSRDGAAMEKQVNFVSSIDKYLLPALDWYVL